MGRVDVSFSLPDLMAGFDERMGKLALFDPLFELARQKRTDQQGNAMPMMELGLLTLLFFFEQKLMRSHKTSVKDLSEYLSTSLSDIYDLEAEEWENIGRRIIQVFRPSSGKKREFPFYHFEKKQEVILYSSILKTDSYDIATNTQYYALDEDGLALIFATKEFYVEFQLSIHQLLLRKQLEKGEFHLALRQIDEMRIDVESLQERIVTVEHEIKRSIVSEDTLRRYQALIEDIIHRLERENDEFNELRKFVRETQDHYYAEREHQTDQRPYALIFKIALALENVHNAHSELLFQCTELQNTALRAARESLYYSGLNAFNFDQDIVSYLVSTPLPTEALRAVVAPFLPLEQVQTWSLLTVFAKQPLMNREEGERNVTSPMEIMGEKASESDFLALRVIHFTSILEALSGIFITIRSKRPY
nr:replicative DNA helicase [Bacilli bacterium]